jgi:hypothetical protein
MNRYCYNQFQSQMRSNYGPGPTTAGTTTVHAPALPSISMVPNPSARSTAIPRCLRQTDGRMIQGYTNPDQINVGQGTNHKGNI